MERKQLLALADLLIDFQTAYPEYENECEDLRTAVINQVAAMEAV